MNIHVVQPGETIDAIAESYGVSVARLIQENELSDPDNLVPGQTIVITYPQMIYTVEEGDTLLSIAESNNTTVMQLLRNNAYLADREYIYPGDTLVISYNQNGTVSTIGYTLPFINQKILRKTLPYLTYLFVYNYRLMANGEVETFYDDTEIIKISKEYGTVPIMLVTTLTAQGIRDPLAAYEILLNTEVQDKLIDNIIKIMETKGYQGLNLTFLYMTTTNESLYNNFTSRVSSRLENEGFILFVTIDPGFSITENDINFIGINYSTIGREVRRISFVSYVWSTSEKPPSPVNSIENIRVFLEYVATMVPSEKINSGLQVIAYNWEIPYVAGFSKVNSISLKGAVDLARNVGAFILFDEVSQSPYFEYTQDEGGYQSKHLVWFVDARTVNAIVELVDENNYRGPSVWNIMDYYPQLWLVLISQFEIEKLI